MPVYEYQCKKCETCFEKLVFTGDDELRKCPACGTNNVVQWMSWTNAIGDGIGGAWDSGSIGGFSWAY